MKNMKIENLYDLSHTLAKDYLGGLEYPWQALKGISEFIIKVGNTLSTDE